MENTASGYHGFSGTNKQNKHFKYNACICIEKLCEKYVMFSFGFKGKIS